MGMTGGELRERLSKRRASRVREAAEEQGGAFGYDRAQEIQEDIERKVEALLGVFAEDEVPDHALLALVRVAEIVACENLPERDRG